MVLPLVGLNTFRGSGGLLQCLVPGLEVPRKDDGLERKSPVMRWSGVWLWIGRFAWGRQGVCHCQDLADPGRGLPPGPARSRRSGRPGTEAQRPGSDTEHR